MSDKRGYLQKKGRGAFSGIAWKPRYCVLSVQEGSLRYYTDDKLSKAKGAVDLTQEQLTVRPTAVKKSAFQITSSVRSWWFAAKSDAERDEWIKAIRAVQEAKKSALKFTPTVVTRVVGFGENFRSQLGYQATSARKFAEIPAMSVSSVTVGDSFAIAIADEGTLYGWGWAANGRLCVKASADANEDATRSDAKRVSMLMPPPMQHTPKQIPSSLFSKHKIVSVALGKHHAVAMTSEHDIYTWGRTGPWLGLGDSPADDVHVPRKIEGGFAESKVVRIGAGNQMSAAVSETGKLFLWGFSDHMEPETFEPWKKTTPEHYDSFDGVGVHSISFGERHFLVLMDNKSVYSWGCNESGQLGHGSLDRAKTPKHIEALMGASIDRVAAGADYSLALSKTGMVYAWGNGSRGNLAINFDTIEENIFINKETQVVLVPWMVESLSDKRVQKIAAGGIVSLFLCDGHTYACGENIFAPAKVDTPAGGIIKTPALIPTLNTVADIAAGEDYCLIVETLTPSPLAAAAAKANAVPSSTTVSIPGSSSAVVAVPASTGSQFSDLHFAFANNSPTTPSTLAAPRPSMTIRLSAPPVEDRSVGQAVAAEETRPTTIMSDPRQSTSSPREPQPSPAPAELTISAAPAEPVTPNQETSTEPFEPLPSPSRSSVSATLSMILSERPPLVKKESKVFDELNDLLHDMDSEIIAATTPRSSITPDEAPRRSPSIAVLPSPRSSFAIPTEASISGNPSPGVRVSMAIPAGVFDPTASGPEHRSSIAPAPVAVQPVESPAPVIHAQADAQLQPVDRLVSPATTDGGDSTTRPTVSDTANSPHNRYTIRGGRARADAGRSYNPAVPVVARPTVVVPLTSPMTNTIPAPDSPETPFVVAPENAPAKATAPATAPVDASPSVEQPAVVTVPAQESSHVATQPTSPVASEPDVASATTAAAAPLDTTAISTPTGESVSINPDDPRDFLLYQLYERMTALESDNHSLRGIVMELQMQLRAMQSENEMLTIELNGLSLLIPSGGNAKNQPEADAVPSSGEPLPAEEPSAAGTNEKSSLVPEEPVPEPASAFVLEPVTEHETTPVADEPSS